MGLFTNTALSSLFSEEAQSAERYVFHHLKIFSTFLFNSLKINQTQIRVRWYLVFSELNTLQGVIRSSAAEHKLCLEISFSESTVLLSFTCEDLSFDRKLKNKVQIFLYRSISFLLAHCSEFWIYPLGWWLERDSNQVGKKKKKKELGKTDMQENHNT